MSSTTSVIFDIVGRDRASDTFDKIGKATDQTTSKMAKFHKVGAAAGKALAIGLAAAGAAAIAATKAAAEDAQAQAQLAQSLRTAAGATDSQVASVEDWISAQGKALGVADDQLRPAIQKLAIATGDLGESQKLASIAMDVSATSGKSLESVTQSLAKAYSSGSVTALSKYGIAAKNADGSTKSLAQVTDELAAKYKGSAATAADTVAGKQKILAVQFAELQEQIGTALLPALSKLAQVGLTVVHWVSQNTKTVGVLVGSLGALLAITWGVSKAIQAWTAISQIAKGVQAAWTGVQWALNAAMTANPIGLVVVAIAALVAAFVIAYKKSETFRDIVNGAFGAVASVAQTVFGAIVGFVSSAFDWIKDNWTTIAAVLTGPIGIAVLVIAKNWDTLKTGVSAVKDFVVNRFKDIGSFIGGMPGRIRGALSDLTRTVRDLFDDAMSAGLEKVRNIGGTIKDWITAIPGKLLDKVGDFKDAGKALIGAVVDGMKNAAGVISGIAGNVWDAVRSMLNAAIDRINAALEFTINLPGPDITVNPPNIPHLAQGGIVTRPTLALIGEAGPEAVIPLSRDGRSTTGSDTVVQPIQFVLDGKVIQQSLLRVKRANGGLELGLA